MLVTQLAVQLSKSLVLGSPGVDLLLQSANLVIFAVGLLLEVCVDLRKLLLERLHSAVVLLEHKLVILVLCSRRQVLLLELGHASLRVLGILLSL